MTELTGIAGGPPEHVHRLFDFYVLQSFHPHPVLGLTCRCSKTALPGSEMKLRELCRGVENGANPAGGC